MQLFESGSFLQVTILLKAFEKLLKDKTLERLLKRFRILQ